MIERKNKSLEKRISFITHTPSPPPIEILVKTESRKRKRKKNSEGPAILRTLHDLSSIDRGRRRLARYRYLIRGLMDIEPRWRTRESSPLSWRNLHFSLPHPHPPPPSLPSVVVGSVTRRSRGEFHEEQWTSRASRGVVERGGRGERSLNRGADRVTSIIIRSCYGENICLAFEC